MRRADTVNPAQLLAAAEQLMAEELAAFAADVVALRARRLAASLDANEAALLQRMNASVPAGEAQRYAELVARRDGESLSGAEHAELLRLSDAREERHATRIAALAELAALRGVTLDRVLHDSIRICFDTTLRASGTIVRDRQSEVEMKTVLMTIPAHFDGEKITLDVAVDLKPNTQLLATILSDEQGEDDLLQLAMRASSDSFARVWDNEGDAIYDIL
jgi:hypothetical protein